MMQHMNFRNLSQLKQTNETSDCYQGQLSQLISEQAKSISVRSILI